MIQVASQQQMKITNAKRVLELIRTHRQISRAAIAKMTNLSPTTVSSIVEELIKKGIVIEKLPLENKGAGRKAISLEINHEIKYIVGMEMNQQGVTGTVFNLKTEPVCTIMNPFDWHTNDKQKIAESIISVIGQLMNAVQDPFHELLGICIGVPALLDSDKKSIVSSTVLHVTNLQLKRILQERFDFPIYLEDETLLAAAAEKEILDRKTSPFIYLSINDGLGAAVIIGDQYLQGANGDLLEIGHMSLDVNGKPCPCGNRGCFELHVSVKELAGKAAQALTCRPDSVLSELLKDGKRRIEEAVAEAVQMNDQLAIRLVEEMAVDLGNGIVNLINIFNPQTVVIGGRLSALGDLLHAGVCKQVSRRAFKSFSDRCTVELAKQRDHTVSRGAAIYLLDKVLESQVV